MRANAPIHAAYGRVLAASRSADEYVAKLREAQALAGSDDPSLVVTLNAVLCHALRLSGRMRWRSTAKHRAMPTRSARSTARC